MLVNCILYFTLTSILFFVYSFSHVSGNKIGWEKTGTQSENQTRGDLGDQTKVILLYFEPAHIFVLFHGFLLAHELNLRITLKKRLYL